MEKKIQICSKCVMDSSDTDIYFDKNGVCNYCHQYEENKDKYIIELVEERNHVLERNVENIKRPGAICALMKFVCSLKAPPRPRHVIQLSRSKYLSNLLGLASAAKSEYEASNIFFIIKCSPVAFSS